MEAILNWFATNYEWIFSGIGVVVLGLIFKKAFSRKRKKTSSVTGDQICTTGDFSPAKVGRDYKVTIHQAEKAKPPKKS